MKRSMVSRAVFAVLVGAASLIGPAGAAAAPQAVQESAGPAIQVGPQGTADVPVEVRRPDAPPVYPVRRVARPPRIDGKLDEAAWKTAPRMERFHLDSGDGPMPYETIARLVRDDTYVYLAVDCRHPNIGEPPARKGSRDQVNWAGETIEVWFDTDRTAADYVQVIFDMSGAFTDTYGGLPKWDGDITAATEVGGEGWRLEARLKLADLGGPGDIDRFVWGGNVARNSGDDSGSWARLLGSYQQPDHFGLLTFAEGGVAVEDAGLGVFGPPAGEHVPVRLKLRNISGERTECVVSCSPAATAGGPLAKASLRLEPGEATEKILLVPRSDTHEVALAVTAARADGKDATLFRTILPVKPLQKSADCTSDGELACAIRPACEVALAKDQAAAWLMGRSLSGAPLRRTGQLSLVGLADNKVAWRAPVALDLPADGSAAVLVPLPAERMVEGQYRLEWSLAGEGKPVLLRTEMVYVPMGLPGLERLLVSSRLEAVLAKIGCAVPKDMADRAIVQVRIDRLTETVQRQTQQRELDLGGKIMHAYRQLMQVVAELRSGQPYSARQRGWFEAAFYSPADGSAQPFSLFVPLDYDKQPDRRYPLAVYLHGKGGTHGGEAGFVAGKDHEVTDRIVLNVLGRGRAAGYGSVVADEVMREIREVIARYRIDADAVHIGGQSMGGFGVFGVASTYPDLFATARPYCGGAFWPLGQMQSLPTYVHHGLADTTVPPVFSVLAVEQMRREGCPVQLFLYPDVGHDVVPSAEKISRWETLQMIKRDPQPATVVLTDGLAALKKAYWLSILRYSDIHKAAHLRATFAGRNHLVLDGRNVAWLKVSLPCKWIDADQPVQIADAAGRRWIELEVGQADALYVRLDGEKIEAVTTPPMDFDDAAVYTGGGAPNMFHLGRPVRIVYGTAGSAEQTDALANLARSLRRWNPFSWGDLETGGWPILKDSEVDAETLRTCDLVLLGTPKDNSLLARMADKLPVRFAADRIEVSTEPAMSWPESDVVFSLYYRNPLSPQRRIWWFAGMADRKMLSASSDITRNGAFGQLNPELIVQAKESMAVIATACLTPDWKLFRPAPLQPSRPVWDSLESLDSAFNQALRESLPVDVSLVSSCEQPDMYDWDRLSVGEGLAILGCRDLWIVRVLGKQLRRCHELAAGNTQADGEPIRLPWAGVLPDQLDADTVYDVLLAPDTPAGALLDKAGVPLLEGRFVPASHVEQVKARFVRPWLVRPALATASQPAAERQGSVQD